jgi:hypothetical protein
MEAYCLRDRLLIALCPWQTARSVDLLAREIARQCRDGLWRRIHRQTTAMSISELRGYASAYALGYVEEETVKAIFRGRLKPAGSRRVARAAVDRVVELVVHDFLSGAPPTITRTAAA